MTCDLEKFKTLIEKKAGIQITDDDKLRFAIEEMIAVNEIEFEIELFELVRRKKEAFEDLVGFLTINETYFFRESYQIEVFANDLIPLLVSNKKTVKINILSAGCSTGAEPYSLVIALMEKYGKHISHLFSVKAFDIDKKALKIAEEGVYGKYHFRGLENRIIEKYFDKIGEQKFKLKSFVRDMVVFYPHNLLHFPFPDVFSETDVMFYRNVAIYFSSENQKKIFINLSKMLRDNAWLIMSSTETLPHDFQVLSLTKVKDIFVYQKKNTELKKQDDRCNVSKRESLKTIIGKDLSYKKTKKLLPDTNEGDLQKTPAAPLETDCFLPEVQIQKARELARNKKYTESLAVIDELPGKCLPQAKAYTIKAGILMNLNKLDEAKNACLQALTIDEFSMEGFLLLGIIAKLENDPEGAEEKLKKTIYIDSSCWLAHYYLAEIYRSRGESEKSFKKYEIVIKQLEKVKTTDTEVLFGAFSFSEKELIHACRRNMENLQSGL